MIETRKRRAAVFLFFLLALGLFLLLTRPRDGITCMGVPILSEAEQEALGEYAYRDDSQTLRYNGQKAAVDLDTSRVFIAQDIAKGTKPEDLPGRLGCSSPAVELSFAPDEAFEDLAAAVAAGHAFRLNVSYGSGKYMQYDLIFTTLPVLRLEGQVIGINEKGKDICEGTMCLWTPMDPDTNSYSVKTSNLQWHVRGGWSSTLLKTPFKVDLKKKTGTGKNLSLVGLGADDDWILNPMNLDDTKLKETLFMELWNRRAEQVTWNEKMSQGEYVEVVIDQEYWGLFQLQRRIDRKFLGLGSREILLKSGPDLVAPDIQTAYEIIHTTMSQEDTYALVRDFHEEQDGDILNMDNFLDVNLFFQWASAVDNKIKNIFFLLETDGEGYRMSLLPWDTDMSWGVIWGGSGFAYDFETSRQNEALRIEYEWMHELHPDLDQKMAERWFELREELLTLENAKAILSREQALLDASGAQKRDEQQWGLFYQGEDSLENLCRSIEARMAWVDEYYGQYLK